jgi:hypothetical protein
MSQLKKMLFRRLQNKGMQLSTIPGFMRSLSNSCYLNPNMNLFQVNQHLRYMGWDDVELDYYTFQLAIECLRDSGMNRLEYKPVNWFETNFAPDSFTANS